MLRGMKEISEEQIHYYRENGFVQIDQMLNTEEVEELREYLNEVMRSTTGHSTQTAEQGNAYYKVLNQRVNTWRDHGGMARFVLSERLADAAKQLTGFEGIRLFHDHALYKMPQDSKPTPWHQDWPYWPMKEQNALSIWIALDDVDEHNGCMMFVPKSQKIKNLKSIDLVEPQDIFEEVGASDIDRNKAAIVRMKEGSCTFHHGLTFHYAHANLTDQPRRALAIIYMEDGTTFSGAGHLCTDAQNFQVGDLIRGGLFPRLA
ncbi:SnoK protein [Paenibacillus baekrokdamisoli]|uniref:SnoK protein n=1 Tax=Paenibacillus baekrokdamisoli TaxID=1712516 RepID=A0A3G9IZ85_9BACL|nr:phytanoyl-CoA dioxygenase family protein [Paenibacillus baekrokdamisoli]MBB3072646.1 ectoine hydroxylase-related dioxygenase (phytanoyl-CoA dioxygenase family) [Paenibacillus baekrokdamisoli]BBH18931.1 SnoK protein [Paenibacillus baekrokdamisoli]